MGQSPLLKGCSPKIALIGLALVLELAATSVHDSTMVRSLIVLAATSMCGFALLAPASEFESLFDGRSLTGWETPDLSYWSIDDGAITGRITREHPCETNQYLVWNGGEPADFELKLKSRLNGEGGINNGFQFRSRLLPDHDVCGYQMDNNLLVLRRHQPGRHESIEGICARGCVDDNRRAVRRPAYNVAHP